MWLDAGVRSAQSPTPLPRPYPHEEMSAYAASLLVNDPAHEGPRRVAPSGAMHG